MVLIKELKNRRKITSKLSSKDIEATLSKMYQWVTDQNRLIKPIEELIDVIDNLEIPKHSYIAPGIASLKEQAAIGFVLLGCCYRYINKTPLDLRAGIWDCADKYYLIDYQNTRYDHRISKIRSKYLLPFWDYLIEKIGKENDNYTIESKINFKIASVFHGDSQKNYPNTFQKIEATNQSLNHPENTWDGVANSCRGILIEFGKELLQNYPIKDDVKDADSKNIIRLVLKEELPNKKFNRTLIDLFESSWDHVASGLHRGYFGHMVPLISDHIVPLSMSDIRG